MSTVGGDGEGYGAPPVVPFISIPLSELENLHEQIRLRGELIEKLRGMVQAFEQAVLELTRENERLRAELVTEHDIRVDTDHAMLTKEAEIERLRAALTEIMQGARGLDYAIHIARVALAKPGSE